MSPLSRTLVRSTTRLPSPMSACVSTRTRRCAKSCAASRQAARKPPRAEPLAAAKALRSRITVASPTGMDSWIALASARSSEQDANGGASDLTDNVEQVVPARNGDIDTLAMDREQRLRSGTAQAVLHAHGDVPSYVHDCLGHDLFHADVPHFLQCDQIVYLDNVAAALNRHANQVSTRLADELVHARAESLEHFL